MAKERLMAIFIGLIMILSVGGFAVSYAGRTITPPKNTIPNVVERELNPEEVVSVLRSGRVLIEDFYTKNCTICTENNAVLESFADKFKDFVVLEKVVANETTVQMIGVGGKIVKLGNENITKENLMDIFCDIAITQPNECLLREI